MRTNKSYIAVAKQRSALSLVAIIQLCIPIVLGCNGEQPLKKTEGELMIASVAGDQPKHILRHNESPTSEGDWKLQTWTTGETYAPGEPIDLGLHLSFTGQGPKPMPMATMRLRLKRINDPAPLNRELTIPFKVVKGEVAEWEVIMVDVFKTDSHGAGPAILQEGDYLFTIEVLIERKIVLRPLDTLIKIDNVDGKNLIDYYREHYPGATKHNVITSSVENCNLTTWTTGAIFSPGEPIELGLALTFKGQWPKPLPKASARLDLINHKSGHKVLHREFLVPFKKAKGTISLCEAIMADVFKTHSHRPGAWILQEGDYDIKCVLQIDNGVTTPEHTFPIKILNSKSYWIRRGGK